MRGAGIVQVAEDEVLFCEGWEGFGGLWLGEMLVGYESWRGKWVTMTERVNEKAVDDPQ